jgi:hypothetical protein
VARVADWSFLAFGVILLVAPILLAGQVGYADFVIAPLLWIAAVVLIGGRFGGFVGAVVSRVSDTAGVRHGFR